nr:permease [Blastococcus mobilis]
MRRCRSVGGSHVAVGECACPVPRLVRRPFRPPSWCHRLLAVVDPGRRPTCSWASWSSSWCSAGCDPASSTIPPCRPGRRSSSRVCLQALPFLGIGVLLSAAISAFVPPSFFQRALPRRPALAVPVAGLSGAVLPGCECASVPVAGSLVRRGVAPAAALAFLLSAPAINPVVLVATAVAFSDEPFMVAARFAASLLVAVVMGWLWTGYGRGEWLRLPRRSGGRPGASRLEVFRDAAGHDLLHAGGFLVVGGLTAATLNVAVPRAWLDSVADSPVLSVVVLRSLRSSWPSARRPTPSWPPA